MEHRLCVEIATKEGIAESIVLLNIYFWCKHNSENAQGYVEGRYWTYNSAKAFATQFPYLNAKKVERILRLLTERGYIIRANHNNNPFDKTSWYSLSDRCIDELELYGYDVSSLKQEGKADFADIKKAFPKSKASIRQICSIDSTKMQNGSDNFVECIYKDKKHKDIKQADNNKETLKEKECALFEQWWKAYGKKVGKKDTLRAWLRLKESEQQECLRVVCEYVASTPEVQYRKNPITYLHQRAWEDEIIKRTENTNDYGNRHNTNPAEAEREQRMRGYAEVAAQFLAEAERDRRERGIGGNIAEALPH